jgi:hypothetical protein
MFFTGRSLSTECYNHWIEMNKDPCSKKRDEQRSTITNIMGIAIKHGWGSGEY